LLISLGPSELSAPVSTSQNSHVWDDGREPVIIVHSMGTFIGSFDYIRLCCGRTHSVFSWFLTNFFVAFVSLQAIIRE